MPAPVVFRRHPPAGQLCEFLHRQPRRTGPHVQRPGGPSGARTSWRTCFPRRDVVGIHALDLVWGLGTLHCMTQQEPARRPPLPSDAAAARSTAAPAGAPSRERRTNRVQLGQIGLHQQVQGPQERDQLVGGRELRHPRAQGPLALQQSQDLARCGTQAEGIGIDAPPVGALGRGPGRRRTAARARGRAPSARRLPGSRTRPGRAESCPVRSSRRGRRRTCHATSGRHR